MVPPRGDRSLWLGLGRRAFPQIRYTDDMDEKFAIRRSIFAVRRWKWSVLFSLTLAFSLVSYAALYGLLVKKARGRGTPIFR